jgi:hypothetical protein
LENNEFKGVVTRLWSEPMKKGWMASVLKNKLKVLKVALKKWNKDTYACVKGRKIANGIVALKKGDVWLDNPNSVKEEICNYFENHFSEEVWERPTMDGIVFPNLSVEEGGHLERPLDECEVKDVIDSSHNNKSPGPDGFNFEFFRGCWG